jgi:hypothetical protein
LLGTEEVIGVAEIQIEEVGELQGLSGNSISAPVAEGVIVGGANSTKARI